MKYELLQTGDQVCEDSIDIVEPCKDLYQIRAGAMIAFRSDFIEEYCQSLEYKLSDGIEIKVNIPRVRARHLVLICPRLHRSRG